MDCEKIWHHKKYIEYEDFKERGENYTNQLCKRLPENAFNDSDHTELHSFLLNMSSLTGLLLISSETKVKWTGTGFIVKLRRQRDSHCPCPIEHRNEKTEHAIVTISTAYHVFNDEKDNETKAKRYDEVNEIWEKYKTEFKLYYDDTVTGDTDKRIAELPTMYGNKLIEMDKDLDLDCDWCAIECVTHDPKLIETLEKAISDYQKGLAELYKKSQKPRYKDVNLVVIIGHPHGWEKRISIGQTRKFRTAPEKEILKEVRSRQTWCRYSYDNVTCPGSSGSPIFKWGQPITGFGYWFGHPHNHSEGPSESDSDDAEVENDDDKKRVYFGKSTIGVESIY